MTAFEKETKNSWQKGIVKISDELTIYPGFTFEEFKRTSHYNMQDERLHMILDGRYHIGTNNYAVSLIFHNGKIYLVSLLCVDVEFDWKTEPERKKLHDKILKKYGFEETNSFDWGELISDFDPRGCSSDIIFTYKMD